MGAPPAAVTFDLHGTLVDDTSRWGKAIEEACTEIAGLRDALEGSALAAANVAVWEEYYPTVELDLMVGRINEEQLGLESWRRSLRKCGVEDEAMVASARQIFMRHYHASHRLFDDVAATLDALGSRAALGVVTNAGNETRKSTIARLGIADLFATVVVSAEIGIAKPDPRIFEVALAELDLSPPDVWHVGDNPNVDVVGAKEAGLTSVWLNRKDRPRLPDQPEADHTIKSLRELPRLLGSPRPEISR